MLGSWRLPPSTSKYALFSIQHQSLDLPHYNTRHTFGWCCADPASLAPSLCSRGSTPAEEGSGAHKPASPSFASFPCTEALQLLGQLARARVAGINSEIERLGGMMGAGSQERIDDEAKGGAGTSRDESEL